MAKKKSKARKKPDLPDSLIYKTPHGRGSAKDKHKKKYFDKLKEEDYNPKGKEDFDKALRSILESKGDALE